MSAPRTNAFDLDRRQFLQALGAGVTVAMLPPVLRRHMAAASPLRPSDGIVVLVYLAGGHDGSSMLVPLGDSAYWSRRGSLAVADAVDVGSGWGLHPQLAALRERFMAGGVAAVNGVGMAPIDLSHFQRKAAVMGGHVSGANPGTGWAGRALDRIQGGPYDSISVDFTVPLTLRAVTQKGLAVPSNWSAVFGATRSSDSDQRLFNVVGALAGDRPNDLMGQFAAAGRDGLDLAGVAGPLCGDLTAGGIINDLAVCARLINADLGTRVFHVTASDYDTHAGQSTKHRDLLGTLDHAIARFWSDLDPGWSGQVTMVLYSEFGRRATTNGSSGTDHGSANSWFLIGDRVRGGMHGGAPSWSSLDGSGSLTPSVDVRSVWAALCDQWLAVDSIAVIGGNFKGLDLLGAPNGSPAAGEGYRLVDTTGQVSGFGSSHSLGNAPTGSSVTGGVSNPAGTGYWLCTGDGQVFAFGNAPAYGGMAGRGLSAPVVSMASTASGRGYWLLGRDGGVFSFGDAAFFGSTGATRLNAPIVALAATPSGRGYWLLGADGGVFCFGDAPFFGSTGADRLNAPVNSIAPTPSGRGYWLVASDGGVFCFGDAAFHGSAGALALVAPVVGLVATDSGEGYWLVARDGGVFCFGDAEFRGSLAGKGRSLVALLR